MSWHGLERCTGPACPHCGCQDAEILRQPNPDTASWWADGRARCNHCGREFAFKELPQDNAEISEDTSEIERPADLGVPFIPVRCPDCRSDDVVVTSTRRPIRWHRCRKCGARFKSVEKQA
jgi:ribosomal protein S27E